MICDIDDTIKISNVLNKRELMRNSFFRPYKPVQSMSRHLRALERKGAYFHYVSAAPWQLYPSLRQFLDNHVPRWYGFHAKFTSQGCELAGFLGSSEQYKVKTIAAIIKRYPKHRFILIGDSGEHDPEVYGRIARQFPQNMETISIRKVEGSDLRAQRFTDAFKEVPQNIWDVRRFDIQ